jgi:hypothetical protein
MRARYLPEDLGNEVVAPSGYYQPLEEAFLDYSDKRLVYILGTACIDASCCGTSSWKYLRVEGYVVESNLSQGQSEGTGLEIETIEDAGDRAAISSLLLDRHPGVRIEFR